MKLVIFGAAGGTGRELLEQALAKGHEVRPLIATLSSLRSHIPS